MFRHQSAIIREFINNKVCCAQQVFQALFALTSTIWHLSAEKCGIWYLILSWGLLGFIVFRLVQFVKGKSKVQGC